MREANGHSKIAALPRIEDVMAQARLQHVSEEHETLKQALAEWVVLIRGFIAQVEGANFTDRHGHSLELNQAYIDLKDSVSE